MRSFFPLLLVFAAAAWSQTPTLPKAPVSPKVPAPAEKLPPNTIIASFEGKTLTFGEFEALLHILPPQMRTTALRDRRQFVHELFLMQHLAALAEQHKLDQQSPTKESLYYNRLYVLTTAELNYKMDSFVVPTEDLRKVYDANKERYSQVRLKVIYIPFNSDPSSKSGSDGTKELTEAEAKAKIENILGKIHAGADFGQMARKYSEDTTSAKKDGDFGVIRHSDKLPDAIRNVVFSLKAGQVSDPVRQPNGYYIFRAEQISIEPFAEVRDAIFNEIKNAQYKQWLDSVNRSITPKIENDSFFETQPQASALH